MKKQVSSGKSKRDLTKMTTPHTYVIIFGVVILAWLLTFIVPAGKFSTQDIEYQDANGETSTRTVLRQDSFRYAYALDRSYVFDQLEKLQNDPKEREKLKVPEKGLEEVISEGEKKLTQEKLDEISLTDDVLYDQFGERIYDTSKKLHKTARVWGTDDFGGFGFLNFVFEGLVSGDKYGSAVGIAALILVVGGAFGIIMRTGAIDAGIYAFISKTRGLERLALPLLFFAFSFGGATFGMAEEVIPFSMVMVPFVIALGYDSIVAVTVTYVASQVGNATSWMSPFSVAVAQGIAGIPVLSGATFRLIMWVVITALSAGYLMIYGEKIRKKPESSLTYKSDDYFRSHLKKTTDEKKAFMLGHKLILLEMLIVLVWIVWGVTQEGYYIPEIASQFFVMGLVAGIIAVIFKLDGMRINDIASSFQSGAADLAGTAIVVGMAKGILLVLGGSDASVPSALNTILHGIGTALAGVPAAIGAWAMYIFQSLFNLVVTSNSGQAALTMPIMAPLADLVGVSRQVAVLAYQLGAGFMDAFTPVSASLIGVLGVARIEWAKWARFQIKMQGFFFVLGTIFIMIAIAIGLQ
ncbi:putative basic amino acid antiporter YfcC [Enterococcus hirae]|uniref:putative basic amino acid antiporter YfcC n=1 Tax=Enterococcus hirae TaxID=1354 RepID=UPI0025433269|nr:putative basic amino acid antiporter YfcC [Enterococcus hirae]EMF0036967.1 putative basic amino acid antiporter YfcC [Enterococcus hirae]EMF0047614.1 putative basic amino acid antiporter YfcC [Enterococcus hirae]EMF0086176.1 putative basic amino acid antiporter YfcC [Enterococcus hirae]EMF0159310.1 putative basic amino acid antiporter YfcC [Enterococcus hirae]EMF0509164.1 putative basic amino acid antiporter YfcC [Enterococcus hirae]